MNHWIKSIFAGLFLAIAGFFLLKMIPGFYVKTFRVHYIVGVHKDPLLSAGIKDIMLTTLTTIERRAKRLDRSASANDINPDHIEILLDHIRDTSLCKQTIEANHKLEFREVYGLSQLSNSFQSIIPKTQKFLTPANFSDTVYNKGGIASIILFDVDSDGRPVDNGIIGRVLARDTALLSKILSDSGITSAFPAHVKFYYNAKSQVSGKQNVLTVYAIRMGTEEAPLQGKDIKIAQVDETIYHQPEVIFEFNEPGSRKWERMTTENRGRWIAIIIDKKVISAPHVLEPIYGGKSSISGGYTRDELESLARQFNAGNAPARLSIDQQDITPNNLLFSPKVLVTTALLFLIGAGLGFLVFNGLKRR